MQRKINSKPTLWFNKKYQKGMVLVYTVIFAMAATALSALAIDLARAFVVSNQLKSLADTGALTAAASFLTEMRAAVARGEDVNQPASIHNVMSRTQQTCESFIHRSNERITISKKKTIARSNLTITLQFGQYDTTSSAVYDEGTGALFADLTSDLITGTKQLRDISAFRVTVARSGAGAVQTLFAGIFGVSSLSFSRNSVSVFAPRNFILVIDTSGSMDDISYPRTTTIDPVTKAVHLPDTLWPAAESFISRPTFDPVFPILFSSLAPAPAPPLYPEPLQTVLNSSLAFLQGLATQTALGDKAGVYYFATHASSKLSGSDPMLPVNEDNLKNIFVPLFSNNELYQNLVHGSGPMTLSNGRILNDPTLYYVYTGASAYDPLIEQFTGAIAIPQGNTNVGDAILSAVNDVNRSSITEKSISIIILFTDGMPDCAPVNSEVQCFGTGATPSQLEAARDYAFQQARLAIQQNIRIYPITYGNLGGGSEEPKARLLFDAIAQLSGLPNHFNIPDSSDVTAIQDALKKVFDEISLFIPFSLVG